MTAQSPSADTLLLDARALAAELRVSRATIWRLAAAGKLPTPIKVGGSTRWRRSDVSAWIVAGCPAKD